MKDECPNVKEFINTFVINKISFADASTTVYKNSFQIGFGSMYTLEKLLFKTFLGARIFLRSIPFSRKANS